MTIFMKAKLNRSERHANIEKWSGWTFTINVIPNPSIRCQYATK